MQLSATTFPSKAQPSLRSAAFQATSIESETPVVFGKKGLLHQKRRHSQRQNIINTAIVLGIFFLLGQIIPNPISDYFMGLDKQQKERNYRPTLDKLASGHYNSPDTSIYVPVEERLDTLLNQYAAPGQLEDNDKFVQMFAPRVDGRGGAFATLIDQYAEQADHNPEALEALKALYNYVQEVASQEGYVELLAKVPTDGSESGYYAQQSQKDIQNFFSENNVTSWARYVRLWEIAAGFFQPINQGEETPH